MYSGNKWEVWWVMWKLCLTCVNSGLCCWVYIKYCLRWISQIDPARSSWKRFPCLNRLEMILVPNLFNTAWYSLRYVKDWTIWLYGKAHCITYFCMYICKILKTSHTPITWGSVSGEETPHYQASFCKKNTILTIMFLCLLKFEHTLVYIVLYHPAFQSHLFPMEVASSP